MTETRVVNLRTEKCQVIIDGSTKWGDPFRIGPDGTRAEVIAKYREYIASNHYPLRAGGGVRCSRCLKIEEEDLYNKP